VLHAIEAIGSGQPPALLIPATTVVGAVRLGRDYLLPHAQAAFAVMGADPRIEAARAVLASFPRLVAESSVTSVTSVTGGPCLSRREIHRHHHRRFLRAEDVDPVLDLLVRHGWLYPTGEGKTGRGGHPSPTYFVHPLALQTSPAQNEGGR